MRYSAVTSDPNNFNDEGFTLRQKLYEPPRRTELLVLVTMYNESDELFCRTMYGAVQNISHLCTRHRSSTWGKDAWKKVVVCIISDGRRKVDSRVLCVLAMMGVYQTGVAKVCHTSLARSFQNLAKALVIPEHCKQKGCHRTRL